VTRTCKIPVPVTAFQADDHTRVVTQHELRVSPWQKVDFLPGLPKVSRQEAQLFQSLEWLFPAFAESGEMLEAMSRTLQHCLQSEVQLTFDYFQLLPVSALPSCIAEPTFLAVLSFHPYPPRGFWEMELGFAHKAVEMLLGGASSESVEIRALTELEEGVLQFLALQVLREMFAGAEAGKVHVRLDNILGSSKPIMPLVASETQMVLMSLSVSLGGYTGYFRFFIPATVLGKLQPHADAPVRAYRMQQNVLRAKPRLALPRLFWRVEIGYAELSLAQLKGLCPGDTVILDELHLRADKQEDGRAELRIGTGFSGHLDCKLCFEGKGYKAEVEKIILGTLLENTDGFFAGEGKGEAMDPKQLTAAPLLSDVPMRLVVELARIPVTLEEVVEMKVGHIVDLGRLATDPLNLVVNGKTVGQGELVEFEGRLGVRLIAMDAS